MSNLERLNEVAAGLPESVLGELVDFAEFLKAKTDANREAVLAWHAALPEEDEELTPEAVAALEEARRETETIPWDQLKSQLGL